MVGACGCRFRTKQALRSATDLAHPTVGSEPCTVKNAVELFFAFHPDVEKIQYH
jgi:hypothetical protein